jgi:hypothetical protein
MRIFRRRVEITAENAALRLDAPIRTAFERECQADGRRDRRVLRKANVQNPSSPGDSKRSKTRALHLVVLPGSFLAGAIRNYSVAKSA